MPCMCGDTECPSCGLAQGTLTPPRGSYESFLAFSCRGAELYQKQIVLSRKPQYPGGQPAHLQIRKARKNFLCRDCHNPIEKGDWHGGAIYEHLCLACVEPDPECL